MMEPEVSCCYGVKYDGTKGFVLLRSQVWWNQRFRAVTGSVMMEPEVSCRYAADLDYGRRRL